MKLSIGKWGDGSVILPAALAIAAFLAAGTEPIQAAQIINASSNPPPAANTPSTQLPWIAEVTKMADAGVAPDVMETYVKNTPSYSTLSVDDILYLKSHGIADNVVAAMIQHGANAQQAAASAAATAAPAPQYAPPPQYYAAAPAQSDYPADYNQGQSSVYVIPQYYPNYYPNYYYPYPYYYSYGYPFYYWNYGFGGRRFFRDFDHDHDRFGRGGFHGGFGRPGFHGGFGNSGFHGGFGGSGFHGGFNGHANGGGRSPFSPVASIGFHGGGGGMHSGGGGMGMHGGGGGMGGHGFHR